VTSTSAHAAIAAHRFGLGEPDLGIVGGDVQGWLLAQIGPADPQRGTGLPSAADGLRAFDAAQRARRQASSEPGAMRDARAERRGADPLRELVQADMTARLSTAAATKRPFAERLALFWETSFKFPAGTTPHPLRLCPETTDVLGSPGPWECHALPCSCRPGPGNGKPK